MAFYQNEPFGWEADLYGHAVTSAAVYNHDRKRGSKAISPLDFLPKHETQEKRRTEPHSIYQAFRDMAMIMKKTMPPRPPSREKRKP